MADFRQEVAEKVRNMMEELCASDLELAAMTEASDFRVTVPSLDSLDHVELVMMIEEEWSIDLADDEIAKATTFGDLVGLICRKAA